MPADLHVSTLYRLNPDGTKTPISAVKGEPGTPGKDAEVTAESIINAGGAMAEDLADKQDKLVAGDGIEISEDGKTISATGEAVEVDTTLSAAGKAADAKAVGDALAEKADIGDIPDMSDVAEEQIVQNDRLTELESRPAVDPSIERRLANLEAAAQGKLYREDVDSTEAYEKQLAADVLPWATLDKVGGKTLVWNQLAINNGSAGVVNGIEWTIDSDGVVIANGTANANSIFQVMSWTPVHSVPAGHVFFVGSWLNNINGSSSTFRFELATMTTNKLVGDMVQYKPFGALYTNPAVANKLYYQFRIIAGTTVTNMRFRPIVLDLTAMFGTGNEPTVEQVVALFGDKVYPYSEPTLMSYEPDDVVSAGRNIISPDNSKPTNDKNCKWQDGVLTNIVADTRDSFMLMTWRKDPVTGAKVVIGNSANTQKGEWSYAYPSIIPKGTTTFTIGHNGSAANITIDIIIPELEEDTYITGRCFVENNNVNKIGGLVVKDIQLAKGKSVLPYAPYFQRTIDLSPLVSKYFPNGMRSAGTVYDEIDIERGVAVQRVGAFDVADLAWFGPVSGRTHGIYYVNGANLPTDLKQKTLNLMSDRYVFIGAGGWAETDVADRVFTMNNNTGAMNISDDNWNGSGVIYYELETPIETPIDPADLADLAVLQVEAGGSLTFVNQHGSDYRVPMPNQETFVVKVGDVV